MLIAHRGVWNKNIKENSMEAFIEAISNPIYSGFELDIYTSLDGEFMIHHSPLVDGKFIWKYDSKTLKEKGLVSLIDVLKLDTDKIILIEIKDINIDADKFVKLLKKYKYQNIYVMSFFNSVMRKFDNKRTFKIGLLNYILNSDSEYHYDFICLLYDVATPYMIDSFKQIGIEVFLYAIQKKDKLNYQDVYYIVDDNCIQK